MQNEKRKMKNVNPAIPILHFAFSILHWSFAVRLCALCVLCGNSSLAVQSSGAQEVVLLNGERFTAELVSINSEGRASFRPERSVPLAEIVRWGFPVGTRPQPIVLLEDGSRIVAAAAWSGPLPIELLRDELIVRSDLVDDLRMPRGLVRGIVFAERSRVVERDRLEDSLHRKSPDGREQDKILLTNDDQLRGRITEIGSGTLTLSTESGLAKIPLSRIQSVFFANSPRSAPESNGRVMVALRDGSLIRASSVTADDQAMKLQLDVHDLALTGGQIGDIVALQALSGPRLTYLSDFEASDYRHVPYLSIEWPYERDRNVRGGPLVVGGNRYIKGIGMHSAARLSYRFDEAASWRRFETSVAIDDSAGGRGSVTFGVHVLRGGRWQAAHTSGIIRGGERPTDVSVDVSGATGLTLTVDYAERGDELDHADWLDARLVK
jgi:hypothetical protein